MEEGLRACLMSSIDVYGRGGSSKLNEEKGIRN
jgi:hypothetical protein